MHYEKSPSAFTLFGSGLPVRIFTCVWCGVLVRFDSFVTYAASVALLCYVDHVFVLFVLFDLSCMELC